MTEMAHVEPGNFSQTIEWYNPLSGQNEADTVQNIFYDRLHMDSGAFRLAYATPLAIVANRLTIAFSDKAASSPDFNIHDEVRNLQDPIIEVGGPTPTYKNPLIHPGEMAKLGQRVLVTNVRGGGQPYKVDMLLDGSKLPFRSRSLGMIATSYLPDGVSEGVVKEAVRVLLPGGFLMNQGLTDLNFYHALSEGFQANAYRRYQHGGLLANIIRANNSRLWNAVLQKPCEDS